MLSSREMAFAGFSRGYICKTGSGIKMGLSAFRFAYPSCSFYLIDKYKVVLIKEITKKTKKKAFVVLITTLYLPQIDERI